MPPLHFTVAIRFAGYAERYRCVPTVTNCRDSQRSSCASRPNRRETSPFAEPTSLRCDIRSEAYTGQRDYAERLRSVSSFRKTGRTHSADHLCLTPRRQAARGTAERALAPIASQSSRSALPSRSQSCWLALTRLRQKLSSRPGTRTCLRGGVGVKERLGLRCSFVRACGLALLTVNSDNKHCESASPHYSGHGWAISLVSLSQPE